MDLRFEIKEKIEEYSKFVRDVLRPDLEKALKVVTEIANEISVYEELRSQLAELEPMSTDTSKETQADLGYSKLYCKAIVTDLSRIFVHVGMGFHVELSNEEAIAFINRRLGYLHDVLKVRKSNTEKIRHHIRESEIILDELSRPNF